MGLRCNFAALHEITDQRGLTSQILPADSTQIYFCLFLIEIVSLARVGLNLVVPGQVAVLQEERNSLLAENDVLTDRANQLDTFDDPSTPSGRKHSQLQQHFEALQEENFRSVASCLSVPQQPHYGCKILNDCVSASFRLEAAKDDYRIHCEELEKQLIEVQHRNDELTSLAEESRALKDELDVLRFVSV